VVVVFFFNVLLYIKIGKTKIPLVPMVTVISRGKHTMGRGGCCSCLFFIVFKVIFYAVFVLSVLCFF